jgi:ribonuclease R
MDIAPERLLAALREGERLDAATLAGRVGAATAAEVIAAIEPLVRARLVAECGGDFQRAPAPGVFVGRMRCTFAGRGFVVPIGGAGARADIAVRDGARGGAIHGDTVAARQVATRRRAPECEVVAVLRHAPAITVGRLVDLGRECVVLPVDERYEREVVVEAADAAGARHHDVVSVEIVRASVAGRPARGRVLEVLGRDGDPGLDAEIIVRKHGLRHAFSAEVLAEADATPTAVSESEIGRRRDLRGWQTVTIDGETARDFDDAVSIVRTAPDRWSLGVHIADVSRYVREGSALDIEALRRGTSVYFPDRAIPMLPERLSNGICSLNPREDRLTISAVVEVDASGRVHDYWVGPSAIHSRERLTYTEVNALLTRAATGERVAPLAGMLREMETLALALAAKREADGAIDFDLPEAVVHFDDEGRVGGIARAERNVAHRIVEQFMLLANETVARHLTALGVPLLYRVHEPPDEEKVAEFAAVARSFGHPFAPRGEARPADYQRLARRVAGLPEGRMLSYLMLRSLRQARYTPTNLGHFGLATDCYTHFTSPIRRYPDLVVHRILREALERAGAGPGGEGEGPTTRAAAERASRPVVPPARAEAIRVALEHVGGLSSERERAAEEAEREAVAWKRAEFLSERLGDDFEAVITDVKEYGFHVELAETYVEGFVHASTLVDDDFTYRERTRSLVGRRTRRAFRIGDTVRVRLDRVDRGRHLVDFSVSSA